MRQRVLLVAGWAVAAAVTSFVASGAVAVAGGQVTDRALRPLSASEVAALPVVNTGVSVSSEPHASGGLAATSDALDEGAGPSGPGRSGSLHSVGDGGPSADDTGTDLGAGALDPALPDGQPLRESGLGGSVSDVPVGTAETTDQESAIVRLAGGSASVSGADGEVYFLWAIAQPGYLSEVFVSDSGSITITFSSGVTISRMVASWTVGGLQITRNEAAR